MLSPVLFLIFINELLTALRVSGIGARWAGLWLAALLYADDVVLIADSWADLQLLLNIVKNFCEKWRMSVNKTKTQIVVYGETAAERQTRYRGRGWYGAGRLCLSRTVMSTLACG